jgi:predicted metal-dependent TIM-barrel fold hydrolase
MDIGVTYSWDDIMPIYKLVGPERIVLGSDCGHYASDHPIEAMRRLIVGFLIRGVPKNEIEIMCKTNSYNLLH